MSFVTIKEVMQLLKPWADVTTELSAEKNVTVSKIIPIIYCIRRTMEKISTSSAMASKLKYDILANFTERTKDFETNRLYTISTFLDPRYKDTNFEQHHTTGHIMVSLRNEMSRLSSKTVTTDSTPAQQTTHTTTTATPTTSATTASSIWNVQRELQSKNMIGETSSVNAELTFYRQEVANMDIDPLQYWKTVGTKYPKLRFIALQYLTIMGTSVPCERLFSKAGDILSSDRSRIKPKHLEKLLFLASLPANMW